MIDKLFAAIEETIAAESGKIQIVREIVVARSGGTLVIDGDFQSEPAGVALNVRIDGELVEIAAALFGSKVQLSEELARNPIVEVLVDEDSVFVGTSATSSSQRPWNRVGVGQGDQSLSELGIAVPLEALEAPHFPILEVLRSEALVDIGASPLRTVRESRAEGIVAHIDPHAIVREVVSDDLWTRLVDAGIDELDIGPPIEVGVWVTNGHIGAIRIDLSDLFAQIGALDIAPSLMEQLSQSVWMRLSIEIWDVGVANVIEYPPPDQVATP